MKLNTLQRVHPNQRSAQVGRGGKRGKTSGRGGKGQTARAGNKPRPEFRDALMKIPKQRGRGMNTFKSFAPKSDIVSVADLERAFSQGDTVTAESLLAKGLIHKRSGNMPQVKILGDGVLTKKLAVSGCAASASARKKIEAVGGSIL
ncbi:MAG: 50S ribosomal protein L15 [Parcubacteria group bacterium GW2011_GWA2_47_12]|nr:MAG: 50S ribosomal protein L15 [Parcubacteria group bacterium GW2011_GWA2_47_12]